MKKIGECVLCGLIIVTGCGCAEKKVSGSKPAAPIITAEQHLEEQYLPLTFSSETKIPLAVANVPAPKRNEEPQPYLKKRHGACEAVLEHYDATMDEKIKFVYRLLHPGIERIRLDVTQNNNVVSIEKPAEGLVDLIRIEPRVGEPIVIQGSVEKPVVRGGKYELSEAMINELFVQAEKKIDFYSGFFGGAIHTVRPQLKYEFDAGQREEQDVLKQTLKLVK